MTHLQGQAVTSLTPWPNKDPMLLLHIIRYYLPPYMALTSHKTGPLWEPQISHNIFWTTHSYICFHFLILTLSRNRTH